MVVIFQNLGFAYFWLHMSDFLHSMVMGDWQLLILLHFTASCSDLHWTAQLRVQRSCSVEQSAPSLARKHVTGYI